MLPFAKKFRSMNFYVRLLYYSHSHLWTQLSQNDLSLFFFLRTTGHANICFYLIIPPPLCYSHFTVKSQTIFCLFFFQVLTSCWFFKVDFLPNILLVFVNCPPPLPTRLFPPWFHKWCYKNPSMYQLLVYSKFLHFLNSGLQMKGKIFTHTLISYV